MTDAKSRDKFGLCTRGPKLAAAILVATRGRNPWLPFIAGMAVLLGLKDFSPADTT